MKQKYFSPGNVLCPFCHKENKVSSDDRKKGNKLCKRCNKIFTVAK